MSTVSPIPTDYPRVFPMLCVDDADAAIGFYARILGATERMRLPMPDGRVGHAELAIGEGLVTVSDEFPDWGALAPGSVGGSPVTIMVYVEDVDAVHDAAVAAGATSRMAPDDRFYGDRVAQITDPFGHRWSLATRVEDVSPEEMTRRMEAWTAEESA